MTMTSSSTVIVSASLALALCPLGYAQRPTSADLSKSAIESHVRISDPTVLGQRIDEEHQKLRVAALNAPHEERSATVVFKDGFTPRELDELARQHELDVARAELKVPVGEDGRVFTISIGSRELLSRDGSLRERLEKAIGKGRAEFFGLAQVAQGAESDRYRELTFSRSMLFFKAELIGQTQAIESVLAHARVAAVFLDETTDDAQGFRSLQRIYAEARRNAPPSIMGVPAETMEQRARQRTVDESTENNTRSDDQ